MKVYNKLLKPISEVKYLSSENVERYRVIIRYFFQEYENIKYWIYKEDVYQMMIETNHFPDYTMEKCQSDLDALLQWGNITALQDTTKVSTLEAYRNKRYRYQLNEYTVEIERMILKLENLEVEGASLEPTLLERLQQQIFEFPTIIEASNVDVSSWWRSLNNDFIRLNQDYQDYIRTLNGHKAEEMMKSEEFLLFKDQLVVYLRTFVKSLQEHGSLIAGFLESLDAKEIEKMIDKVVAYEVSIPRLERQIDAEDIRHTMERRWQSLYEWFVGRNGDNELERLFDITNDIIRKITRYAQQIGEMRHRRSNRKEEYRYIAKLFGQCEDIYEAHTMSANVFGVTYPFHLNDLQVRETDDISSKVYAESPTVIEIEPRARVAKKTNPRNSVEDYALEQKMMRLEIEEKQERDEKILRSYIIDNKIQFENLPIIDAYTRKVLLSWVSKAMQQSNHKSKTEFGLEYTIDTTYADERCTIHCNDGDFKMPKLTIVFEEER